MVVVALSVCAQKGILAETESATDMSTSQLVRQK